MKRLTVISMLVMSAAALCVNASDYLYFHKNGEVVHRLPAEPRAIRFLQAYK